MSLAMTMPDRIVTGLEAEDRLLAAWVGRGDRGALGELFARCRKPAYALAARLCGADAADDAVQDGLIKAMRGARNWRGAHARAWVLATVANAARDRARSDARRRRRQLPVRVDRVSDGGVPGDDLVDALRDALAGLPRHEREAIELRFFADLDLVAVADALGRSYKTVHSQIERGLSRLAGQLVRRGFAASAVTTLLATIDADLGAGESAEATASIARICASGPRCASAWSARMAISTAAAMAVVAVVLALPGRSIGTGDMAHAVAGEQADPLDTPISVRLVHDRLDHALAALGRGLPAEHPFRYAIAPKLAASWEGVTWIADGPQPLRAGLDAIAAQIDAAWSVNGAVVVMHPRVVADAAALDAAISRIAVAESVDPGRLYTLAWAIGDDRTAAGVEGLTPDPADQAVLFEAVRRPDAVPRIAKAALDADRPTRGARVGSFIG